MSVETRLALRELADRYASLVDRRDIDGVAGLFTEDGSLLIHGPGDTEPRRGYEGRSNIRQALGGLSRFRATSHLVGGQLLDLDGRTGETYCLASHVYDTGDGPRIYVMSLRYQDAFAETPDGWRFAVRRELVDWAEDRPFQPREV